MSVTAPKGGIVARVRKRGRLVAVLGLSAAIAGSVVALAMPRVYHAEVRVDLTGTGGLTGESFSTRADEAAASVMSHASFFEAAAAMQIESRWKDLPEEARRARCDDLLAWMREHTSVALSVSGETSASLAITAGAKTAEQAEQLARALAASAERLAQRETTVQDEQDVERAAAEVVTAEAAAAAARRAAAEYRDGHREFTGGSVAKLQATRDQKKQLRDVTIAGLETKKRDLDRLLSEEKEYEVVKTRQPDAARLAALNESIASAYEDIRALTVVEKKTESDPAVVEKRAKLAALEETKKSLVAGAPLVETRQPSEQWARLGRARADVQSQIDAAGRQLRALASAEKEQEELARRAPEFEAKQAELDAAETAANTALERRTAARTNVERNLAVKKAKGALVVHVAEQPSRPSSPSGPGAVLFALCGLVVGAFAGTGAALVADTMDHSLRSPEEAAALLGVPVVAAVETIETPAEATSRRREERDSAVKLIAFAVVAALFVGTAAYLGTGALSAALASVTG